MKRRDFITSLAKLTGIGVAALALPAEAELPAPIAAKPSQARIETQRFYTPSDCTVMCSWAPNVGSGTFRWNDKSWDDSES